MSDEGEVNLGSDPKFQRFAASIERALKGFELSREWQDLISCLSQLNKVLLAYIHFNVLPYKHLVCRRLSQCLHPSLPGGVHLKVLDVYKAIFDRIGHEGLARDLFLYSSGLFPLLEHGSMPVRPVLLDLYEQYYLPLGVKLLPGLSGFISALLPGLEEGSEHTDKVIYLLDSLFSVTNPEAFICALWNILLSFPFIRLSAHIYIHLHLSKGVTDVCKAIKEVDACIDLIVSSISSSLLDSNVLVQRYTLDLVIQLLPLKNLPISQDHLEEVMRAVLQCLLKRDQSIVRRVFTWLLGSMKIENTIEIKDFDSYVKPCLLRVLRKILAESSTEKSKFLQPYRLFKVLCEQSEVMAFLFAEILPNIVACLKVQIGTPAIKLKKDGKHSGQEILHSANHLLLSLDNDILWKWMKDYLSIPLKQSMSVDGVSEIALQERSDLVIFLLQVLPLVNMESALSLYLPNLLLHLTVALAENLSSISFQKLCIISSFIIQSLVLLKKHVQMLFKSQSTPSDVPHTPSSPHLSLVQKFDYSYNPLEGCEMSLGSLVVALLHQSQCAIQLYVSTHVCDMEGVSSKEVIAVKIQDILHHTEMSSDMGWCKCIEGCEEDNLAKNFTSICAIYLECLALLQSFPFDKVSFDLPSSSCSEALVIACLCKNDTHLFLSSLNTLLVLCETAQALKQRGLDAMHNVLNLFSTEAELLQIFSLHLWSLFSPIFCGHHEEAAHLLCMLLCTASSAMYIEDFFLKSFTKNTVEPYKRFATFWQYLLQEEDIPIVSLNKSILRMMEGLQSQNSAIVHCTSTWLISVCQRKQLDPVLQPLYNLLRESCPSKVISEENEKEEKTSVDHSKYFYESLEKEKEGESEPHKLPYPTYYFTQLLDSPRYSYGLSLFLSVYSVSPELVCAGLINTISTSYFSKPHESSTNDGKCSLSSPTESSKSLMEIILNDCMELLCSDYPHWLDTVDADLQSLFDVKVMSATFVVAILTCWIKSLNGDDKDHCLVEGLNPSYIRGLLALCEVQKVILTTLLYLTSLCTAPLLTTETISLVLSQQSLFLQLLRALYCLILLEAVMIKDSPLESVVVISESSQYVYIPSYSLTSQSMLHELVLEPFSQTIDSNVHIPLLAFISVSLPFWKDSLERIAPKLVKNICRNLANLLKKKFMDENNEYTEYTNSVHVLHYNNELIVSYLQTLTTIVHYCLTSMEIRSHNLPLNYQCSDLFWDVYSFQISSKLQETLPTKTVTMDHKRSFSFSWIFSGIFNRSTTEQVSMETCNDLSRGISTSAGQKVLWSLHLVYGTLTHLWKDVCVNDKQQTRKLTQDVNFLIKQFLQPILKDNDILFYSSIAQTWMQWNLTGKTKQQVRDDFIQLLHIFKLSSLEDLISSVSCTLTNMRGSVQNEERQKYLLHFLYRYISSSFQSSDELLLCYSSIVHFLKECHSFIVAIAELDSQNSTPLLCMLMSICHVFVCRVPVTDLKENKKRRRELQDVIYNLSDSLSQSTIIKDAKLEETENLNPEKIQIEKNVNSNLSDKHEFSLGHEVQAMAVLANVLSHFVDCVYDSSEKDRIISLLKTVLRNVWPSLHNFSPCTSECYIHAVKLLASLSGFQVTRKCWKDEVMEWFLNAKFFIMEESCITDWKVIIDNLMSQDKFMFRSLLSRIPTSSSTGMVNIFSSLEIERVQRAKLFKRIAFVIACGERGQYSSLLPDIQEKLLDSIRWYSGPTLNAEVLTLFKVLMLKLSTLDLNSLWPALLAEMTSALSELQSDISLELATPLKTKHDKLLWYYSACKLLNTALSVPSNLLPQFQMISWGYFGEKGNVDEGIIGNILDMYKKESLTHERIVAVEVIPHIDEIKTALHLVPVLSLLEKRAHTYSVCNEMQQIKVEETVMADFVE